MSFPPGLHVVERPPVAPGAATVVLVHGSLDRAESFQRTVRRLPDAHIVTYDRRGYQGSRKAGVVGLSGHVADLVHILAELRGRGAAPLSAVGHSFGGDIVIGAALAEPQACDALGAFEPPMPWLDLHRLPSGGTRPQGGEPSARSPGDEAERFFGLMVSPSGWQRLSDAGRASRRADGPALAADLATFGKEAPFEVTDLAVPAVFGRGGSTAGTFHRDTVAWLGSHVPGAMVYEIASAQHGAHLSHPDHFAAFTRRVMERAVAQVREKGGRPPSGTGESGGPCPKDLARRDSKPS